jgi:hypothetical protein
MDKCMSGVFWKLLLSASLRYFYTIVNNSTIKHCCASCRDFQEPENTVGLVRERAGCALRRVV